MAASWTNIQDNFLEPGKPVRSVDGLALRDNPIAIAQGASGAPRVQNAAINNGAVTNAKLGGSAVTNPKVANRTLGAEKFQVGATERNWVLARTAAAAVGAVGTYAMLQRQTVSGTTKTGGTMPGSGLRYATADGSNGSIVPSGTWRNMGLTTSAGGDGERRTTLWLRVS